LPAFTSSFSTCYFTYTLTLVSGAAVDSSLIAFTDSPPTMSVYTTNTAKVGIYSLKLTGTNTVIASKTASVNFNLKVIINPCFNVIVTPTTFSSQTFAYNIASTILVSLDWVMTNTAGCSITALTYTLTPSTGTLPLFISLASSPDRYIISGMAPTDAGTYDLELDGCVDIY
jgi:hypothetical protein